MQKSLAGGTGLVRGSEIAMFLKELSAVLIPWWLLAVLLTGDRGFWHWPILIAALYIVMVEIHYRLAIQESRAKGFHRMVRVPVASWLLRLILWRRMIIPHGVKCYTLHVHGNARSDRELVRELKVDIALGMREPAVYVGNTFYDLGEFAHRQLGDERVQVMDGALFGSWLQTWRAPSERWRIVKIETR